MAIKVRDLIRALKDAGAYPVSTNGSHQKWKTPSGGIVVVTINHSNREVCKEAVRSARLAGIVVNQ